MTMIYDIDDFEYGDFSSFPYEHGEGHIDDWNNPFMHDFDLMVAMDMLMDASTEFEMFWNSDQLSEEEMFLIVDYLSYHQEDFDELTKYALQSTGQDIVSMDINGDDDDDDDIMIIDVLYCVD
ncbi:unnamed protein product [Adineta steineri]|uniref:Uncharacterized protein n=1 Tax=Adineta steineri TaxID=433720 RepID=A0A819ZSK7_9BILA|nr:unnamed protein product [Adineta steineri]CAF4176881.1 unnamed protein product [Adineta steineri]